MITDRLALMRALFDSAAAGFERDATPVLAPLHADFARYAAPTPGDRVLDLGTGTGSMAWLLAERAHTVTGIDVAMRALALVREHPASAPVHLVCGDLHRLPFKPHSFTLITASFALNATLPHRTLPALRGVLAPGGRFVLQEWGPASPIEQAFDALIDRHATATPPPELAAWREALSEFPPVWDRYLQDVDDYVAWLEDYGFAVEEASESAPVTVRVHSAETMVRFLLARPDRRAEFNAMDQASRATFMAAARAIIKTTGDPAFTWSPVLFRVKARAAGLS